MTAPSPTVEPGPASYLATGIAAVGASTGIGGISPAPTGATSRETDPFQPLGSIDLPGARDAADLWDVTDPTSPEHRSYIAAPPSAKETTEGWFTTAHNLDIHDERLYTSWYYGGIAVHDIADPAPLARWWDPLETSFWTAQAAVPGYSFLASSASLTDFDGDLHETRETSISSRTGRGHGQPR